MKEDKKYGMNITVEGNDSKKAFRNQNLMVNIVIRNPKPSDLNMDTSDDDDNQFENKVEKCEIKIDKKIVEDAKLGI